jgi:ribosome-associated translation inhibitor RaiA
VDLPALTNVGVDGVSVEIEEHARRHLKKKLEGLERTEADDVTGGLAEGLANGR